MSIDKGPGDLSARRQMNCRRHSGFRIPDLSISKGILFDIDKSDRGVDIAVIANDELNLLNI
jgi:hypothetical protein